MERRDVVGFDYDLLQCGLWVYLDGTALGLQKSLNGIAQD